MLLSSKKGLGVRKKGEGGGLGRVVGSVMGWVMGWVGVGCRVVWLGVGCQGLFFLKTNVISFLGFSPPALH